MRKSLIAPIVAAALLVGCVVGPNYHRPAIQAPNAFRAAAPATASDPVSLADLKWFEVFKDEKLQELERAALAQNYDLRDAVARVEAARADLLGAEEKRKAVMTTLVSEVAADYFSLRELDYQLEISQRTLATRQESLELIKNRQSGGVATLLDLRQGEQLVYTAAETIPAPQQQVEQTENQISLLLGKAPGEVVRGLSLTEQLVPPDVPAGLPSALLERRPDIRAAEQNLIAANAEIGVAKAAYFPQISLTGFLGGQGTQLSSLFSGPSAVWNFTPQVTQPIFTAGRIKSNVQLYQALRDSALIQYEKTIQTAFTEVSDALIAHQRVRESRIQQELLVMALQDRTRLAYVRYRGGVDTLLNALDSDRDLFQAELTLSQIRLSELDSVVQLYKALGGGWQ